MALTVNSNIASMNAQRNLMTTQAMQQTAMQRLASGLRINSAKDDAAGLQISNRLTSQINGLSVGIRNANDGISLAQTAEGALNESTNILQRMRELALQSANGSNGQNERNALQSEVTALQAELTRIADTTTFGGRKLLDGSFGTSAFQVGSDAYQTIDISLAASGAANIGAQGYGATGISSFNGLTAVGASAPAINGESINVNVGGNTAQVTVSGNSARDVAAALNSVEGLVGVEAQNDVAITLAAVDASNTLTLSINGVDVTASGSDATATAAAFVTAIEGNAELQDAGIEATSAAGVLTVSSDDGSNITLNAAQATGSTGTATTTTGSVDLVAASVDQVASGTIDYTTAIITSGRTLDITADSNNSVLTDGTTTSATVATSRSVAAVSNVDISSASGAQSAIALIDGALQMVDSQRADLGAIQNRMTSTINNLANVRENVSASRSRIMDADFAAETANMTKFQVMQQAGTAILAQANQLPQNVLSLLR